MESAPWTAVVARKILMVTTFRNMVRWRSAFFRYIKLCYISVFTPARDLLDLMSTTSRDTYRALHYSFRLVGIEKQDKIDRFDRSNSCRAALPRGYAHTQTHACTHAYARRPNRPYSYHINHLLNKGNDS